MGMRTGIEGPALVEVLSGNEPWCGNRVVGPL